MAKRTGQARPKRPAGDPAERLEKCPPPPAGLSEYAVAEWKRLATIAHRLGTLTEADLRGFELLVETLATERTAREAIAGGMTTTTAGGGVKPHPAVRIMETARTQAARLLETFGLNPKGRGSIELPPASGSGKRRSVWDGVLKPPPERLGK